MIEYKIIKRHENKLTEEELNKLGKDRWVLCAINEEREHVGTPSFSDVIKISCYHFYRQKIKIPKEYYKKRIKQA